MKGINLKLIKELIISILIVISIILIVSLLFYDKISIVKTIPEAEEYEMSEEMKETLGSELSEQVEESVIEYSIDARDLKESEKANEYHKGKMHPFVEEEYQGIVDNQNLVSGLENDNNYYQDEGIK